MFRKVAAAFLLILTASPFTAPFSTCDITALLADDVPIAHQQPLLASTAEDGSHTVPLCAASSRIRTRLKLVSRAETTAGVSRTTLRVVGATLALPPAPDTHDGASLTTLRI
jgi:hypothetical protein